MHLPGKVISPDTLAVYVTIVRGVEIVKLYTLTCLKEQISLYVTVLKQYINSTKTVWKLYCKQHRSRSAGF